MILIRLSFLNDPVIKTLSIFNSKVTFINLQHLLIFNIALMFSDKQSGTKYNMMSDIY